MEEKIARICYNSKRWRKPSGTYGKSSSRNSYENNSGYGHEEWLMDENRIIDDYHYGFIEPLIASRTSKHVNKTYKIWLYTVLMKRKYLIGYIDNAICISTNESEKIFGVTTVLNKFIDFQLYTI